jgi:hypothetical protein
VQVVARTTTVRTSNPTYEKIGLNCTNCKDMQIRIYIIGKEKLNSKSLSLRFNIVLISTDSRLNVRL